MEDEPLTATLLTQVLTAEGFDMVAVRDVGEPGMDTPFAWWMTVDGVIFAELRTEGRKVHAYNFGAVGVDRLEREDTAGRPRGSARLRR